MLVCSQPCRNGGISLETGPGNCQCICPSPWEGPDCSWQTLSLRLGLTARISFGRPATRVKVEFKSRPTDLAYSLRFAKLTDITEPPIVSVPPDPTRVDVPHTPVIFAVQVYNKYGVIIPSTEYKITIENVHDGKEAYGEANIVAWSSPHQSWELASSSCSTEDHGCAFFILISALH